MALRMKRPEGALLILGLVAAIQYPVEFEKFPKTVTLSFRRDSGFVVIVKINVEKFFREYRKFSGYSGEGSVLLTF